MKASKWIYVAILAGCCITPALAGYRRGKAKNVVKKDKALSAATSKKASLTCKLSSGKALEMGHGFTQAVVDPNEKVTVTWCKPGLSPNDSIFAYTVHGGRVNGELTTILKSQKDGCITFTFTVGPWVGNYPLILRYRGKEEVLEFWVEYDGGEGGAE